MQRYYPRIADEILDFRLKSKGAVLVVGPKWCGKSTTALQQANSVVYMQDPQKRERYRMMAQTMTSEFLDQKAPMLIDEWQIIPFIWDVIRFEVDKRGSMGQFILTGSAVPASFEHIEHSGIGRISTLIMRPMSLYESNESNGTVSLKELFDGKRLVAISNFNLKDVAFMLCRGGWPGSLVKDKRVALQQAIDYYDELTNYDISRVDNVKRDKHRVERLLRSYARNISTQASIQTFIHDMIVNDTDELSEMTVASYIQALKKVYVIEDLEAWSPNLRSKTAIRKADTRHFVDPSIACAALGLGVEDLLNDVKTFGLLFESMCIRDLRVYAESIDGKVYHYRDKNGLEVDAIIHLRNGNWGAIEVKLYSEENIQEGAKNLLKLASIIDESKMKKPSFLMVLTATDTAYVREDGVYVVPITCLKN